MVTCMRAVRKHTDSLKVLTSMFGVSYSFSRTDMFVAFTKGENFIPVDIVHRVVYVTVLFTCCGHSLLKWRMHTVNIVPSVIHYQGEQ